MRRFASSLFPSFRGLIEPASTSSCLTSVSVLSRGTADPSTSACLGPNIPQTFASHFHSKKNLHQHGHSLLSLPYLSETGFAVRHMSGRVNRNTLRRRRTRLIPKFLKPKETVTMCPKCELVLPDDAVPNRQICNEADCPALGMDWDGETKIPWFKRKERYERERKERKENTLEERFMVVHELRVQEEKRRERKKEKEKQPAQTSRQDFSRAR